MTHSRNTDTGNGRCSISWTEECAWSPSGIPWRPSMPSTAVPGPPISCPSSSAGSARPPLEDIAYHRCFGAAGGGPCAAVPSSAQDLGYRTELSDHAADLSAPFPTEPARSWGDHTIIGLARRSGCRCSRSVTAEANWGDHRAHLSRRGGAGSTVGDRRLPLIIDMTAEDILQRNRAS